MRLLVVLAIASGREEHGQAEHKATYRHDQHIQKLINGHGERPFRLLRARKCSAPEAPKQITTTRLPTDSKLLVLFRLAIAGANEPTAKTAIATPLM